MTSVLVTSTPVHGHVQPLLPVVRALVDAGHSVRFLTGQRYRGAVESAGATFLPLPEGADFDDRKIDETFPGRVGLTGPAAIRYDMIEIFLKPVPLQLASVDEALAAEHTDVILSESMFAAMVVLLARPKADRPPVVNLGMVPLGMKSVDTAPFGLGIPPLPGAFGRMRNAMLSVVSEKIVFAPVQKVAEELVQRLAGTKAPGFFLNWPASADAVIQFTVPEFEYPRSDLPESVHFVGPVSRSAPNAGPLPEWWKELDGSKPVVHVTQGTVANQDWEELVLPTIRGLANDNVLVVVSTGGRDVATLGELPANVRAAEYLPYDELLPRTDVMVTNGGYGGVHFALTHGVPLVVAGMTEDKAEVTARVAWSGAGVNLRTNRPTAEKVSEGVRRVLADPSYRDRSTHLGVAISRSPGAEGALPIIEQLVAARAAR